MVNSIDTKKAMVEIINLLISMLTTLNIKQDAKLIQNKPEYENKLTFLSSLQH